MAYLLDTNILLRESNTADVQHTVVHRALSKLHLAGETLHIAPQILIEFRNVATRAISLNGLGYLAADAESESARFQRLFQLLPETPALFPAWETIVHAHGVIGKQVHDARLAAICQLFTVPYVLTFNGGDFKRFGQFLTAVAPASI